MVFYLLGLLLILYLFLTVAIAVWVGFRVERRMGFHKPSAKWWASGGAALLLLLLPTWNILLGRVYMYYRCTDDGGTHVYRQIPIPARFFDKKGNPQPKWVRGVQRTGFERYCFGERCFRISHSENMAARFPPGSAIFRSEVRYVDDKTGGVLGVAVTYGQKTWYEPNRPASSCPDLGEFPPLDKTIFVHD